MILRFRIWFWQQSKYQGYICYEGFRWRSPFATVCDWLMPRVVMHPRIKYVVVPMITYSRLIEATKVPPHIFRYLVSAKHLELELEGDVGSGNRRKYTFKDALNLYIIGGIVCGGGVPKRAAEMLKEGSFREGAFVWEEAGLMMIVPLPHWLLSREEFARFFSGTDMEDA